MKVDRSRLAGMCYIAYARNQMKQNRISITDGIRAMKLAGARQFRNWMHTGLLLQSPEQTNEKVCEVMEEIIKGSKELDIEICGMNHTWFTAGDYSKDSIQVPDPASEEFRKTCEDYRLSWKTIAARFPSVQFWEVGNEWNHNIFLSPLHSDKLFSLKEKAEITAQMMHAAKAGIEEANPNAFVIMGGLASFEAKMSQSAENICEFFRTLFEYCERYENGYRSCFDIANWHPYFTPTDNWKRDIQDWVDANHAIYEYLKDLGYQRDGVWFTEFGFSDVTGPSRIYDKHMEDCNAARIYDTLCTILDQMPFVEVVHYFRLFDDVQNIKWSKEVGNGEMEGYFGLYHEDITPKATSISFRRFADRCLQELNN